MRSLNDRRLLLPATTLLLAVAVGCDSGSGSDDAVREAFCRQADIAAVRLSQSLDLDPNDPANASEILAVEEELDALTTLEVPEEIREDWSRVLAGESGGLPAEGTEFDIGSERVSQWMLEECDPSAEFEAILRSEPGE
jgi:hypothetical protein